MQIRKKAAKFPKSISRARSAPAIACLLLRNETFRRARPDHFKLDTLKKCNHVKGDGKTHIAPINFEEVAVTLCAGKKLIEVFQYC